MRAAVPEPAAALCRVPWHERRKSFCPGVSGRSVFGAVRVLRAGAGAGGGVLRRDRPRGARVGAQGLRRQVLGRGAARCAGRVACEGPGGEGGCAPQIRAGEGPDGVFERLADAEGQAAAKLRFVLALLLLRRRVLRDAGRTWRDGQEVWQMRRRRMTAFSTWCARRCRHRMWTRSRGSWRTCWRGWRSRRSRSGEMGVSGGRERAGTGTSGA
jgi:hypothetical protein